MFFDYVIGGPVQSTGSSAVIQFVLECMSKLPLIICQATASQVCNVMSGLQNNIRVLVNFHLMNNVRVRVI